MNALNPYSTNPSAAAELDRLERIIRNRKAKPFYVAGEAMITIKEKKYYREVLGIETFGVYCKRWGMSVHRAYQLMASTRIARELIAAGVFGKRGDLQKESTRENEPVPSFVYFIESGDLIKIGVTRNVAMRFSSLRTSSPAGLALLGFIPGTVRHERELHRRFAELRSHGEWFMKSDDLLNHIKEVCHE